MELAKIKNIMPDPFVLDQMELATKKIVDSIFKKKKKKKLVFLGTMMLMVQLLLQY